MMGLCPTAIGAVLGLGWPGFGRGVSRVRRGDLVPSRGEATYVSLGFRCPRPTPSAAAHPHQLGGGSLLSGARQYKVVLRQAVICDLQPYTNEFLEFTYSYSQLFQEELQVHVHQSLSTNLQQSPVDLHAGVD